jgi:hypothetical protein
MQRALLTDPQTSGGAAGGLRFAAAAAIGHLASGAVQVSVGV